MGEAFYSGTQRQIVALNAWSEDFAGQIRIFRNLSEITAPYMLVLIGARVREELTGYFPKIRRGIFPAKAEKIQI